MQLPALIIRSECTGTVSFFPVNVCHSRRTSDYAMAYSIGTSSGGYLTWSSFRAIVSRVKRETLGSSTVVSTKVNVGSSFSS